MNDGSEIPEPLKGGFMTERKPREDLIAYCGLYCGDCFGYQGKVADLARDLRKELRRVRFGKVAEGLSKEPYFKVFADYDRAYELMGMLVKFRCRKACRGGGGPPFCKIRKCCQRKGIAGCWECGDFETCTKLDFLEAVRGDAHIRNLRRLRKKGTREFLRGSRYW